MLKGSVSLDMVRLPLPENCLPYDRFLVLFSFRCLMISRFLYGIHTLGSVCQALDSHFSKAYVLAAQSRQSIQLSSVPVQLNEGGGLARGERW
jgi:hypothetical protein